LCRIQFFFFFLLFWEKKKKEELWTFLLNKNVPRGFSRFFEGFASP